MALMSKPEEWALIAIWKLGDCAYSVTIRDLINQLTQKKWTFGAIWDTLDRLKKKGYLDSHFSQPERVRGGKSKRMYTLSSLGLDALVEIKRVRERSWEGIALESIERRL